MSKAFATARRTVSTPETKNAAHQPLVDPCKVLLPSLHIKLGPMKCFVKALDRTGPESSFLCAKFPRWGMEKIKAGVFSCPQIRQLFKKPQFVLAVSDDEKADWNGFRHVTAGFIGNAKAVNFRKLLGDLITSYEKLGCSMSLKMYFFHSNLDPFLVNCGAASDEYGEEFHLDISTKKDR